MVKGWANTQGGRGGRIVKVTSLGNSGDGTLRAALAEQGPRIIVFEVSGTIDLNGQQLQIREPHVTVAGQTAPSPGITLVRGGIATYTHDVIIQHLRVRPGTEAGGSVDALETQTGSYNVIVDHCSFSWGTDETLSAAGAPFNGSTLEQWRSRASNRITFSNNIVAEALSSGYGSLIQDNVTQILLYGNLWAHNKERTPNFGGATQGAVINNLIYNPGGKFLDYTFLNSKWDAEGKGMRVTGKLTAIGNVGRAGPSTTAESFFRTVSNGDVEYYGSDNVATRRNGTAYPETSMSTYLTDPQGQILMQSSPPVMPLGVLPMSSSQVVQHVLKYVGARPWDRDSHDERILADVRNGTGRMISSQAAVGGYPQSAANTRSFNPEHWDLDTMIPVNAQAL
jgi:pectate lyase